MSCHECYVHCHKCYTVQIGKAMYPLVTVRFNLYLEKISFPITQGNYLKLFENNTQVKLELNVLPTTLARVNPPPLLILHSFSIESNCLKIISLIIL